MEGTKQDRVNHPPHYTQHPSGVECIEITRHMIFNVGNAMKYLWRAGLKGDAIEDLRKAEFYIRDEIARLERVQREQYPANMKAAHRHVCGGQEAEYRGDRELMARAAAVRDIRKSPLEAHLDLDAERGA